VTEFTNFKLQRQKWNYNNPVKIAYGRGERELIFEIIHDKKALIVITPGGKQRLNKDPILYKLSKLSNLIWFDFVEENPELSSLEKYGNSLRNNDIDLIVSIGGGSALDTAKVFSCILSCKHNSRLIDLIENEPINKNSSIPVFTLPTTSGTGSEVTPFATVWDRKLKIKHSLHGKAVYPEMAIVDPYFTDSLPYAITASSALDAFNQAFESIWNVNTNTISMLYAVRSLQLGFPALRKLATKKIDCKVRDCLSESSLLSGLAISQTRTAICHSISYPLTIHYDVPHGIACVFTMVEVLKFNLSFDDGRLKYLSQVLGFLNTDELLIFVKNLLDDLDIYSVVKSKVGNLDNLISIQSEMLSPGRANNNFVTFSFENLEKILIQSWNSYA
jgi:phosphonate metabolism-associated iron-containing alcohol dehydrogenase